MPHYDYDQRLSLCCLHHQLGKYNEGALVGEWVKFPHYGGGTEKGL